MTQTPVLPPPVPVASQPSRTVRVMRGAGAFSVACAALCIPLAGVALSREQSTAAAAVAVMLVTFFAIAWFGLLWYERSWVYRAAAFVIAFGIVGTPLALEYRQKQQVIEHHQEVLNHIGAKAQELISDQLRSPSAAKFLQVQVLEEDGERYLVHIALDSPNAFGTPIRGYYCVVLFRGESQIQWKRQYSVQECERKPSPNQIAFVKSMNDWDKGFTRGVIATE